MLGCFWWTGRNMFAVFTSYSILLCAADLKIRLNYSSRKAGLYLLLLQQLELVALYLMWQNHTSEYLLILFTKSDMCFSFQSKLVEFYQSWNLISNCSKLGVWWVWGRRPQEDTSEWRRLKQSGGLFTFPNIQIQLHSSFSSCTSFCFIPTLS